MRAITHFRPILLFFLASHGAQAANGIVYYNRFVPNTPATVRKSGGDAVGDQAVALNLPEPTHPTLSRSGGFLLATSRDPVWPFILTRNVFLFDLITGASGRITTYFDEVIQGGVRFQRDLGDLIGTRL